MLKNQDEIFPKFQSQDETEHFYKWQQLLDWQIDILIRDICWPS